MDITKKSAVNCVEWFTGYAGNSLGLRSVIPGLRDIAFCEREAFVCANLVSKMEAGLLDAVPIWTDCKTFPAEPFKNRVDIFIASYPCQPFSAAGQRKGTDDERHLWPFVRSFVQRARPQFCFFENVDGHVSLGLNTVLSDLEEDGYTAAWGIFSASEVGAPHQRKRVFILANRKDDNGRPGERGQEAGVGPDGIGGRGLTGGGDDVAHHRGNGRKDRIPKSGQRDERNAEEFGNHSAVWPSRPGQPQYEWEPPRVVGNTGYIGQKRAEQQTAGVVQPNKNGIVAVPYPGGSVRGSANDTKQEWEMGEYPIAGTIGDAGDVGQTQSPLGRNFNELTNGLDFSDLSGLNNQELAEIRGWMDKGTNRTDELRMCGNGVVPATAAKAFTVLYEELTGIKL